MMRRRTSVLCLVLALGLILALAACGRKETPTPTTTETSTPAPVVETPPTEAPPTEAPTTQPAATETPAVETPTVEPPTTQPPTEAPPTEEPPSGEIFAGSSEALQALTSYRYSSLFKFEGEEGGEITAGSIKIQGEYVSPDRQHVMWTDLSTEEKFEMARIGDKAWMKEDDEWTEVPAMIADNMMQMISVFSPIFSWGTFYTDLPEASNFIGKETVNDIPCLHYTSDYKGWGATTGTQITEAEGELWIAEEGGFPVKYVFKASGTDAEGARGSTEWAMELKDVNQTISIEPPM